MERLFYENLLPDTYIYMYRSWDNGGSCVCDFFPPLALYIIGTREYQRHLLPCIRSAMSPVFETQFSMPPIVHLVCENIFFLSITTEL
jgi:hypothetical protein